MLGMWCAEFGQSIESFYESTPEEWSAIYSEFVERQNREFLLAGTIAASVRNLFRGRGSKMYAAADVFPHLKRSSKVVERSPEELRRIFEALFPRGSAEA